MSEQPPPPPPSDAGRTGSSWQAPASEERAASPPESSSGSVSLPPPDPGSRRGAWRGGRLIPLRPLGVGEMLDVAFKLQRATFVQAGIAVVLGLGLLTVVQAVALPPLPGLGEQLDPAQAQALSGELTSGLAATLGVAAFTALIIQPLLNGGLTRLALEHDRDGDDSWQGALGFALRRAGRLLGVSFLSLLIAIVLFGVVGGVGVGATVLTAQAVQPVVAVVPGVLTVIVVLVLGLAFFALLYVAVPALVVEGAGPLGALRRSYRLLRPQLLRTVGVVVLALIITGLVSGILSFLSYPFLFVGGRAFTVASAVLGLVASAVTAPFAANVALLVYTDARVRREGLDVEVLTAGLDT